MYNHIFIMGLWYVKNITGIEKMKVLPSKKRPHSITHRNLRKKRLMEKRL